MRPININELLEQNRIESNRIEYKQGWNPAAICAFIGQFEKAFNALSQPLSQPCHNQPAMLLETGKDRV